MIHSLGIVGFKRFASVDLEFAPLTILAGINGAGKTSAIQALLLLREVRKSQLWKLSADGESDTTWTIPLNGPYGLALGSVADVINNDPAMDSDRMQLRVHDGNGSKPISLEFDLDEQDALYLSLVKYSGDGDGGAFGREGWFTYLCAERFGPRDVLPASAVPHAELNVGVQGEHCAHMLDLVGMKQKVVESLRHPTRTDEPSSFLKYQTEAWLADIARPVELDTARLAQSSVTAMRFRVPGGEWVRAPNMGFGLSYALPIVLAGLTAPTNQPALLIVENPEAHLHPSGQSRMGVFLAKVAAKGVQVVVETHSDHVLNGIRRAIAEERSLRADQAIVHFFDVSSDDDGLIDRPTITPLRFDAHGSLDNWPRRFFDQFQVDVAAIARARRGTGR